MSKFIRRSQSHTRKRARSRYVFVGSNATNFAGPPGSWDSTLRVAIVLIFRGLETIERSIVKRARSAGQEKVGGNFWRAVSFYRARGREIKRDRVVDPRGSASLSRASLLASPPRRIETFGFRAATEELELVARATNGPINRGASKFPFVIRAKSELVRVN